MNRSHIEKHLRAFGLLALVFGSTVVARAASASDPVLAKAREFLGGDAALDAVKSIRFAGTIIMPDGVNGDLEILVRKPMQQRVTITAGNAREITALDDYDGWRRIENLQAAGDWELTLLDARQIQSLRANTIENIGFFKGVGGNRPDVVVVGEETVDGVECVKIAFNHGRRIQFLRSFNKETGQLVRTETQDGEILSEKGELFVNGVRFPKELIKQAKLGTTTIIFTRIQINEPFADDLFAVPMLMPAGR